jgi:hypothetical protein
MTVTSSEPGGHTRLRRIRPGVTFPAEPTLPGLLTVDPHRSPIMRVNDLAANELGERFTHRTPSYPGGMMRSGVSRNLPQYAQRRYLLPSSLTRRTQW